MNPKSNPAVNNSRAAIYVAIGLSLFVLGTAPVPAQLVLFDGDLSNVIVDSSNNQIADVRVRIPEGCFGAGSSFSLGQQPGNLKVPIQGGAAIGGPSLSTCPPGYRTWFNRFNVNLNNGQLFADFFCMNPSTPSNPCQFVVVQDQVQMTDCVPGPNTLCLNDGRFKVEIEWENFQGQQAPADVVPVGSDDSGLFYFLDPDNWEFLVKMIDACDFNDHFWVFYAATTNVGFEMTVEDTVSGATKIYTNPVRTVAPPILDTSAFATCP